jgi:hypothetical protein
MKKKIVVIDEHIRVHQMEAPEFSQSTLASESGAVSPERWAEAHLTIFRFCGTKTFRRFWKLDAALSPTCALFWNNAVRRGSRCSIPFWPDI